MIASQNTRIIPFENKRFKRKRQELFHQSYQEILNGEVIPRKKVFKRALKIMKKIGSEVSRVTSGGTMDNLSSEFQDNIQTHGTLLVGRPDLAGLMNYVKQNKDRIELHTR